MAIRLPDLTARIRVDDRDLKRSEATTKKFSSSVSTAFKAAAGAAAAYGALNFAKQAVADAQEARKVSNLTNAALKSTAGAAKVSASEIENLAGSLARKTGVDDAAIQSGQNLLLTFTRVRNEVGRGNDIFNRATELGLDMSVALGTDAKGAALQLGKALNDPIKGVGALSRAGVSFTAQQRDQIKVLVEAGKTLEAQKIILGELETQFGGAAEAAADPAAKLAYSMGELRESFGRGLLPVVDGVANALNSMAPETQENVVKAGALTVASGALVIGLGKVSAGAKSVKESAQGIAKGFGKMRTAVTDAGGGASGLASVMKGALTPAVGVGAAAVGVAAVAYHLYAKRKQLVTEATQGLIAAQEAEAAGQKGATDQYYATELAQRGLIESAQQMGVSLEDLTKAAKGDEDALGRVKTQTDKYLLSLGTFSDLSGGATRKSQSFNEQLAAMTEAAGRADTHTGDLAEVTDVLGEQQGWTRRKTISLKEALEGLSTAADRAEKKAFDLADATAAYEAALDAANKKGKGNNDTLDLSTKRGRDNYAVLKDLATAANDHRDAVFKETGSVKKANAAAEESRAKFKRVAEQLGGTKAQVEKYSQAIGNVPRKVVSKFTADVTDAQNKVGALINGWKDKKITLPLDVYLANVAGDGLGAAAFAGGSALETVKKNMAGIPGLSITSTYRTPQHNAAIGGSPTSHHLDRSNPAVDVVGPAASLDALYAKLQRIGGRELLWRTGGHYDHLHYAHSGGVVSPSWPTLPGLRGDERPAILQTGETVLARGSSKPTVVNQTINMSHPIDPKQLMAAAAWEIR